METLVRTLNGVAVNVCQLLALFIISVGITKALIIFLRNAFSFSNTQGAFQESRLQMGYSFSLGLGFLIGASILKTTITPKWNDIGQLAAIIAIRTVLNYLLLQAIQKSTPVIDSPSLNSSHNSTELVDERGVVSPS
ncbi:MAG: DUF1622 domain-containing protein [Scytonema sp. PMC 1069.18]|nr:DUF1622 domain-containing protein [Scytonema sp. PMC 1069.18]MEC4885729.1 DUF1622 domain-containing protein [Scytonema sp. PMC 1070.18]